MRNNTKFSVGETITLSSVSRKYACGKGKIISTTLLYSNGKKMYPNVGPNHQMFRDVELSYDPSFGDQTIQSHVVECVNILGVYKETITCTEGMLRKHTQHNE